MILYIVYFNVLSYVILWTLCCDVAYVLFCVLLHVYLQSLYFNTATNYYRVVQHDLVDQKCLVLVHLTFLLPELLNFIQQICLLINFCSLIGLLHVVYFWPYNWPTWGTQKSKRKLFWETVFSSWGKEVYSWLQILFYCIDIIQYFQLLLVNNNR